MKSRSTSRNNHPIKKVLTMHVLICLLLNGFTYKIYRDTIFFFRSLKNHFVRKKKQLNFRKLSIRCNNDTICDGKHPILTKIHSIAEHYKAVFECPSKSMSLKQAI